MLLPRLAAALGLLGLVVACSAAPTKSEPLCTPGNYVFCRCQDRQEGTKACSDDGQSFGPCEPCESYDDPYDPYDPYDDDDPYPDPRPTQDGGAPDAGAVCGDGLVQAGEDCDDGNGSDADGCDGTCKLSGEAPPASNACPGLDVHVWGGAHAPTLRSTTVGSGNRSSNSCTAPGSTPTSGPGPDRVFKVTAHASGTMTVAVTDAAYNAFLYVADACPTGGKVAWTHCANATDGPGGESLSFPVAAGETRYVFVDGAQRSGAGSAELSGPFRVTFSVQ